MGIVIQDLRFLTIRVNPFSSEESFLRDAALTKGDYLLWAVEAMTS